MALSEFCGRYHPVIVGGLVVVVTSYGRFNVPPASRSSTTWARYHIVACLYTLALSVTWLLISNREITAALARQTNVAGLEALDIRVYAAVLLTLVVQVPPFSTFDTKIRGVLQELARIPWEAKRLSAALQARTWLPDERFQADIREFLSRAGFDPADASFTSDRTPQALWTRVTALRRYVDTWQTRRGKFAGFYFANLETISELHTQFASLEANAKRVLPILKGLRVAGVEPCAGAMERELARSFVLALERLQTDLCDLVCRGVLTCGLTGRSRRAEFETIGFVVNVTPSQLFDNLLGLYLVLIVLYIVVLRLAGRPNPGIAGLSIATTYLMAIAMAMLLKRTSWAPQFPIMNRAVAGCAAFAFASLSSFGLSALTTGGDAGVAWDTLHSRLWPWGLMSAGLAALVTWRLDLDDEPGRQRQDAMAAAVACMLLAIPVVFLLQSNPCNGACDPPPYWRVMLTASVMGALVGWFVPSWYRRPEIMTSEYAGWKLIVTVRRVADAFVAFVEGIPARANGTPKAAAVNVPLAIEEGSTDDAIAEAIRKARAWIDAQTTTIPRESGALSRSDASGLAA